MTRYELLDRIGVGGMAEIFRGKAVAAGGFEKPVAIKRILPHLSQDQRFVELLIAEAKVLSLLKHRNIVQIFDVGLGDDGKYFLVMEYVDGKDVGAIQRGLEQQRRRVPYDLVLHIGAEICEALEHAHTSRGPDGRPMRLVHRDVSPSNVILSRAGEVKLTDFGIAKRAEAETTRSGAVRGKFAYISPEQARNEHLDPRSDVFSVGILLWELLVSRRLFSGLPDLEALRGVREAHIPSPTQADSRLPKAIDSVVMTALARDKERRWSSAGEFGAQLRTMRYALDVTVGDPASELARIVDATMESERKSAMPIPPSGPRDFDAGEATVIRIRTADEFSERGGDAGIVAARQVIDRFEDEETRLASLSGDQLRILNEPKSRPKRARAPSDEATRARSPLTPEEIAALGEPNAHLTPTDETKLVAPPRDRRTPIPQRARPPSGRPVDDRARPGPAADAPLTLDEPAPPWGHAPTIAPTKHVNAEAPLTLDEPPSQSVSRSVSRSVSQSVSKSVSQSVSHSVPAPMTLDGATPPSLPAPLKMPASPSVPVLAANPGSGWGPPIASQQPPRPAPVSTPPPVASAPSGVTIRPPTQPPPATLRSSSRNVTLGFRPWMLVVGAVIVALAAFALTRAFIR